MDAVLNIRIAKAKAEREVKAMRIDRLKALLLKRETLIALDESIPDNLISKIRDMYNIIYV